MSIKIELLNKLNGEFENLCTEFNLPQVYQKESLLEVILDQKAKNNKELDTVNNFNESSNINFKLKELIFQKIIIRIEVYLGNLELNKDKKIQKSVQINSINSDFESLIYWVCKLNKIEIMEYQLKFEVFLDYLLIFLQQNENIFGFEEIRQSIMDFSILLVNLYCAEQIYVKLIFKKIMEVTKLCLIKISSEKTDKINLFKIIVENTFEILQSKTVLKNIPISEEKNLSENFYVSFNILKILKERYKFSASENMSNQGLIFLIKSSKGLIFLFKLAKKLINEFSETTFFISETLNHLIAISSEVISLKNLDEEINQVFLKQSLKLLLFLSKISQDFGFLNSSYLLNQILCNISKSEIHFHILFKFFILFLHRRFKINSDFSSIIIFLDKLDLLGNFNLLYNSAIKPQVEYLDNKSTKMSKSNGSRLNENSALIFEFELISLKPLQKAKLIKTFIKLFTVIVININENEQLLFPKMVQVFKTIISHGYFFKNLKNETKKFLIEFLKITFLKITRIDIQLSRCLRNSYLNFLEIIDLKMDQNLAFIFKSNQQLFSENEFEKNSKKDINSNQDIQLNSSKSKVFLRAIIEKNSLILENDIPSFEKLINSEELNEKSDYYGKVDFKKITETSIENLTKSHIDAYSYKKVKTSSAESNIFPIFDLKDGEKK